MGSIDLKVWAFGPSAFHGRAYFIASFIGWWTKSQYTHVGFSLGSHYYEADFHQGVVCLDQVRPGGKVVFTSVTTQETNEWINHQVGKPYDFLGVFGFALGNMENPIQHRKRWFCSELVVAALHHSRIYVLSHFHDWDVSPGRLVQALDRYQHLSS
jgi:hypothetical protein